MKKLLLTLLRFISYPSWVSFAKAIRNPESSQRQTLTTILHKGKDTTRAKSLNITGLESYQEFREKVPLSTWEDLDPLVKNQWHKDRNQICPSPVVCYENTSGSSGSKKAIPYNKPLLGSFRTMFNIWVYDMLTKGPALGHGRIWYSLSPKFGREQQTPEKLKEGFSDDREYLGGFTGWLTTRFLAVPSQVASVKDPDDYFLALACCLVAAEDLEVISVWNPSFLEHVIVTIIRRHPEIAGHLAHGQLNVGGINIRLKHKGALERLSQGIEIYRKKPEGSDIWRLLWPKLQLISCWNSAHAGMSADRIRKLFPHVFLQGKGLLSTEAPITVPILSHHGGTVPLVQEVFLEFKHQVTGEVFPIWQLRENHTYELIITQKGGLWRYQTGDLVKVGEAYINTPSLKFLHRAGKVSDLVGEKLHQDRIQEALATVGYHGPWIAVGVPATSARPAAYSIMVSLPQLPDIDAGALDKTLQQNHHYSLARRLRQLNACNVIGLSELDARYRSFCIEQKKMSLGDIKPPGLVTDLNEGQQLLGWFG